MGSSTMERIRVKVRDNNLKRVLVVMQRMMTSSGIERLIKNEQLVYIKNSQKCILARKELQRKLKSQDLSRKLQFHVLFKKVGGL